MKDLKESGLYFVLSIIVVFGVLGLFLLMPNEIIETCFCIILSVCIFVGFCFLLGLLDGITKIPLGKPLIKVYYKEK